MSNSQLRRKHYIEEHKKIKSIEFGSRSLIF